MKHIYIIAALAFAALTVSWQAYGALLDKLEPEGLLNDFACVFGAEQRQTCENLLREIREKTSAEPAVVTLQTLEGAEINDFANRLFQKWGVGRKKKDNGILILVAVQDRKARIEVGYGLESVIPDAKAGRILDEVMLPLFRQGHYAEGIIKGTETIGGIIALAAGVALSNKTAQSVSPSSEPTRKASPIEAGFFVFIIILFLFFVIRAGIKGKRRSGSGGSGGGGAGSSGGGSGGGFGGGSSGGGGASRGW